MKQEFIDTAEKIMIEFENTTWAVITLKIIIVLGFIAFLYLTYKEFKKKGNSK